MHSWCFLEDCSAVAVALYWMTLYRLFGQPFCNAQAAQYLGFDQRSAGKPNAMAVKQVKTGQNPSVSHRFSQGFKGRSFHVLRAMEREAARPGSADRLGVGGPQESVPQLWD